MKRLTLLRHAKSGWDEPGRSDFERSLNDKGRRAARAMGRHMRDEKLAFDRVAASPATRVAETLDAVFDGYGRRVPVTWDRRIYLAADRTLLDVLHDAPDTIDALLLAGHNPGLEDLVLLLVPGGSAPLREAVEEKFPTAALATIAFDVDDWRDVRAGGGRLERFVRPRDLDPAFGPDS